MADFKGTNSTKAADPSGANVISPGEWGGRVRGRYDTIESATGHRDKVIKLGEVKKGETLIGCILTCEAGWGGSVTGTVKVGTVAVSGSLDLNTGLAAQLIPTLIAGETAFGPQTEAKDITVTISDNAVTADKTIKMTTLYMVD